MKSASWVVGICGAAVTASAVGNSAGPRMPAAIVPIPAPQDQAFPGEIQLSVDATDLAHSIVRVHERVSGIGPETVLLYPRWLPGTHAPEGPIDKLAGVRITANGAPLSWTRDPVDVYAFHVHGGPQVKSIEVDFQYLAATSAAVGPAEIGPDLLLLDWNELVLYPAGYFTRQIAVAASVTLPPDWQFGTAMESASADGAHTTFKEVPLETLIDSPVYAGRHMQRLDLDPGAAVPVHLDLFADRPESLDVKPEQLEAHRALVREAYKLFNSHHYNHYDFLFSVSDQIQKMGLEHHQSSEDGSEPESFTEWDKMAWDRDLLPHEFTHSWNGKFRRPADLWTPNYNVPMQNSLLWVYEGQTQYWGDVLAARSGLRTRQQALDDLALNAAYYENQAGREWRALEDTTNDEIINPRRPISWRDWQRYEDYYREAALVWLDVDTLIRERSRHQRSLDDFARAFFGVNDGSFIPVTYTFDDVVKALNAVEPYDWRGYLRRRLDATGGAAPLDGLKRGGYRLIYSDAPSDYQKTRDAQKKRANQFFSIGLELDDKDEKGSIDRVRWQSPAFKANLIPGGRLLAVNGIAYSPDVLTGAIRAAHATSQPIELIVKIGDRYLVAKVEYHDGLRYPHLERDPAEPPLLEDILAPRR